MIGIQYCVMFLNQFQITFFFKCVAIETRSRSRASREQANAANRTLLVVLDRNEIEKYYRDKGTTLNKQGFFFLPMLLMPLQLLQLIVM